MMAAESPTQLSLIPPTPIPATTRLGLVDIEYLDARSILSPATGKVGHAFKFTLNPYNGCGFGCSYCYARFFAPTPEEEAAWGTWVRVKQNAVRLIEKAVLSRGVDGLRPGDSIYMASATDPYQPIEARLQLTRSILETLLPLQPRLTIQTRSPIVTRDLDLLPRFEHLRVNVSIPTGDESVRLRYEPRAPAIEARLQAVAQLSRAGIASYVCVAPMLPITDPGRFAERIRATGAKGVYIQFFHQAQDRFASSTPGEVVRRARDEGWTYARYLLVAAELEQALAPVPLRFWYRKDERRVRESVSARNGPQRASATLPPRQPCGAQLHLPG